MIASLLHLGFRCFIVEVTENNGEPVVFVSQNKDLAKKFGKHDFSQLEEAFPLPKSKLIFVQ